MSRFRVHKCKINKTLFLQCVEDKSMFLGKYKVTTQMKLLSTISDLDVHLVVLSVNMLRTLYNKESKSTFEYVRYNT